MHKPTPRVLIDTREQAPLESVNLLTQRGTLDTSDYSVAGLEHLIAVERKSLPDLLACLGHGRERFKLELQRLRAYRFRLLVIEADTATIERGEWCSQLKPAYVLGSLASWTAIYGLPVWLAGDHEAAGRFVERHLYQCCRHITSEYEAAAKLVEVGEVAA